MRDFRKYRTFVEADELVITVYELTRGLPDRERYGLQSQLRRAAVSVAANFVEGSRRTSDRDFGRFFNVGLSSATEVEYLLSVAS